MAIKLNKDDYLVSIEAVDLGDLLFVTTENGRLLKVVVDDKRIPVAKRTAMGDPALKIEGDRIVRVYKFKEKEKEE